MSNKVFNLTSSFRVKSNQKTEDSIIIEGFANTTTTDRHGDIILEEAWAKGGLDNYLKNPILLAYHDHKRPIGMTLDYGINSKGLQVVAEISKAAGDIYELVKSGVLKTFSVGFRVKDAEYDDTTDLFVIKDLELYEISVVSVPANADSTFSVRKAFKEDKEFETFKKEHIMADTDKEVEKEAKASEATSTDKLLAGLEDKLNTKLNSITDDLTAALELALESKASEKEEMTKQVEVGTTGAEDLMKEVEKRLEDRDNSLKEVVDGLRSELAEKASELEALQLNKMSFDDSRIEKITAKEMDDTVLLAKIMGIPISETKSGINLIEKSGAQHVPSADWEKEFSSRVFSDIRQRLIVEPLFNTIAMNTVSMQLPINPEAGVGEWIATSAMRSTDGSSTGTAVDHALTDTNLVAYKLAAKEYIGYEEEEDAIIPIVPIIRDAVVRRMARSSDIALLRGQASGTTDPISGVCKLAADVAASAATTELSIAAGDKVDASTLQTARRKLGTWGLNPADVVYVVSQEAYYDLLEDPDFRTIDLVGDKATILRGQIGFVNGSPVVVSGEFETKAATKYAAVAVNASNFLAGTLRGLMVERDKNIEDQKNIIVATRRMGFIPIIAAKGASVITWVA